MKYRKKLWQKRVGRLLMLLLLITQSTPLWASIAPVPVQQVMVQDCSQMVMSPTTMTIKHRTCLKSCCQQLKHCSNTCFIQCTVTALNMLPANHHGLIPHFYLNSVSYFQTSVPAGRGMDVLERPPRRFT